ncbi:MAG TPA: PD-(D/E)XK nuclease family protein, partial [Chitinophagaceae bacterium]|nr:PD-(D/E)XK nuclease family protein [Chitinophagaceae bacterium]
MTDWIPFNTFGGTIDKTLYVNGKFKKKKMTELDIRNFYSLVDTKTKLAEQVKKYYGKEISPNFNSFDFWWLDENKVSQIISFFLNPNERHEQSNVYLRHFLEKFDLDFFVFNEDDIIDVKCEQITDSGRRID